MALKLDNWWDHIMNVSLPTTSPLPKYTHLTGIRYFCVNVCSLKWYCKITTIDTCWTLNIPTRKVKQRQHCFPAKSVSFPQLVNDTMMWNYVTFPGVLCQNPGSVSDKDHQSWDPRDLGSIVFTDPFDRLTFWTGFPVAPFVFTSCV